MKRFALLLDDDAAIPGPVLAINPAPDPVLARIGAIDAIQPDFVLHRQISSIGCTMVEAAGAPYGSVLIRLGRSRDENHGRVAEAWAATRVSGRIAISGAKTDGVDSLAKALKKLELELEVQPKAHGKLILLTRAADTPEVFAKWADAAAPSQNADGFWTMPGIFSPGAVDAGSALLLDHLPGDLKGAAMDLGGGYGVLSEALLKRNPGVTELTLLEADARAVAMARRNVDDSRARFVWGDATRSQELPKGLDLVVMNPPFHEGRGGNPALGVAFIDSAARSLAGKGQLLMVANRHLPYEKALHGLFGRIETLADNGRFKVIRASRPQTRSRRSAA